MVEKIDFQFCTTQSVRYLHCIQTHYRGEFLTKRCEYFLPNGRIHYSMSFLVADDSDGCSSINYSPRGEFRVGFYWLEPDSPELFKGEFRRQNGGLIRRFTARPDSILTESPNPDGMLDIAIERADMEKTEIVFIEDDPANIHYEIYHVEKFKDCEIHTARNHRKDLYYEDGRIRKMDQFDSLGNKIQTIEHKWKDF